MSSISLQAQVDIDEAIARWESRLQNIMTKTYTDTAPEQTDLKVHRHPTIGKYMTGSIT
jgi:predicted component of type VI protein secretion system